MIQTSSDVNLKTIFFWAKQYSGASHGWTSLHGMRTLESTELNMCMGMVMVVSRQQVVAGQLPCWNSATICGGPQMLGYEDFAIKISVHS